MREHLSSNEDDPMIAMRDAITQVREIQRVGLSGYAIEAATYEATANPHNQRLIDNFMDIIPITFYGKAYETGPSNAMTPRPQEIIPALSYIVRVHHNYHHNEVGFIIGEQVDQVRPLFTHVLFAYTHTKTRSTNIREAIVPTTQWNSKRDELLERMQGPHTENEFSKLFTPEYKAFQIPTDQFLTLTDQHYVTSLDGRSSLRHLQKPGKRNELFIGSVLKDERKIRAEDFLNYNVMYNLEILAAAFGVEAQFDQLKAIRERRTPLAPEEALFGLQRYRQTLERTLPPRISKLILRHL